jgi:hypothetical protein
MTRPRIRISTLMLLVVMLGGCSGGSVKTLQGVTFELPTQSSGEYVDTPGEARIKAGAIRITLKGGRLRVNDGNYGVVAKGDHVKVEDGGAVFVNGLERPTEPDA